jgi:hypothetical protein
MAMKELARFPVENPKDSISPNVLTNSKVHRSLACLPTYHFFVSIVVIFKSESNSSWSLSNDVIKGLRK